MSLMPKFLKERVREYCEINNIPITKDGVVLSVYKAEIKMYIEKTLRAERRITRNKEDGKKQKINAKFLLAQLKGDFLFSPIEEYLWEALKEADLIEGAVRQHPIGKCKIDIAYPKIKVAIECDGREYHRDERWQLDRDQKRDTFLARKGWRVVRIEGIMIRKSIGYCVESIRKILELYK